MGPLVLALFMMWLSGWGTRALALEDTELAKIGLTSTVLIVALDANEQPLSIGSGFYVGEKLVATNLHVVAGASSLAIQPVNQKNKICRTEVVRNFSEKVDLVLVDVQNCPGKRLFLRKNKKVQLGENVLVVSNPLGLQGSVSSGIVSGFREYQGVRMLQITAPISPGSSGGPVLDVDGKVIGVATAVIRGGQNLNLAVPVDYLRELLKKPSSPRNVVEIRELHSAVTKGLLGTGNQAGEGVVANELLWDNFSATPGLPARFSITVRNKLREPVRNVRVLVVFYNQDNEPLDYSLIIYKGIIPPGLARRVRGEVDSSVQELTTGSVQAKIKKRPESKVEYRVLYYEIAKTIQW